MTQTQSRSSTYMKRFLASLPAVAALVLTFVFFSPVETVLLNGPSFKYNAQDTVIPLMGMLSVPLILGGAALLACFRGKAHDILLTLCVALALGLYVQGTFLVKNTPPLSGDAVAWTEMRWAMVVDTLIWVVLFTIPFALLMVREAWKYACVLLPVLMLVMQLTGLVSMLMKPSNNIETGFLSNDQLCEYSDQGNTLVFMLDRMDQNHIESILGDNPAFFDRFDGFIRYDNAISQFAHTRNGMNFILTNYTETLFKEEANDFFMHSWDDGERHLLKDLKSAGYTVDLYGVIRSLLGKDYAGFQEYVSNIQLDGGNIDRKKLAVRLLGLSCYRNLPLAMKPFFLESNTWFNAVFTSGVSYSTNQRKYDRKMKNMVVSSDTKFFKFYEFSGAHSPYHMSADGTYSESKTDVVTQAKGCFEILLRAFDRMKEAGIYKDTAIIITADHGMMYSDYKPLENPTRICMFYKPAGVEDVPFQTSYAPVSLRNVPATIIKNAGLDYSAYGVPLDEVPDDPSIVRDYIRTIGIKKVAWKDLKALHYSVLYDSSQMESWVLDYEEEIDEKYALGF